MTLDAAMAWLHARGGKVHVVKRDDVQQFYQVVVGAHRSHMVGLPHRGRTDVPTDDPVFLRAFVQMVETVRQKVDHKM